VKLPATRARQLSFPGLPFVDIEPVGDSARTSRSPHDAIRARASLRPDPSPPALAPPASAPLFRLDPGWLFLIAGLALLAATVLIPAADDLAEARWHRDRATAVENYRAKRLENYSDFLDAVARQDQSLLLSLAATQLNLAPADRVPMLDTTEVGTRSASVFPALEPTFIPAQAPRRPDSTLQRWATDNRKRLWLIVSGGMCVLIGLLPPTHGPRSSEPT